MQYIQLSNNAKILFDVIPSNTVKFQVKLKCSAATGGNVIGGTYSNGETSGFRFFNYENKVYLDYGSGYGGNRIYGSTWSNNTIYQMEVGNRYVKNLSTGSNMISGSSVGSFNYNSGKIGLFGSDITTTFYYFKLWKDNTLLVDAIPVKLKSDNSIGMWDFVTNSFFTSTSGTVTPGPAV